MLASLGNRIGLVLLGFLGWLLVTFFAGLQAGLLVVIGIGFGAVLQGCRFGFTSAWRAFMLQKKTAGITGQMLLMALASLIAIPMIAGNPKEIYGAVAPIGWSLLIGAFVFGIAMQLADGCGSGSLNRAGEGAPLSWVVLPTFVFGSFVGASHQPAWIALGGPLDFLAADASQGLRVDLLQIFGLWPAMLITLGACLAVTWGFVAYSKRTEPSAHVHKGPQQGPFVRHWLIGGTLLALLYGLHLAVAGQPWGIVYGLGLWGAKIAVGLGADLSADPFWSDPSHAQRVIDPVLWDITTLTNIGLLFGAMAASRWRVKADASKRPILSKHWVAGALAGLVLGYTSRLAFGCNIGGFLGGVASASLHGWVWFLAAYLGSMIGVRLRLRLQMP